MKLLTDECCAAGLVEALGNKSHDVVWVAESSPGVSVYVLCALYMEMRV